MDLLGSILNSMESPPQDNKAKELIKNQRLQNKLAREKEKEELKRFRRYVEERVGRFVKDNRKSITFEPDVKIHRAITHEVAEVAGLVGMSFGQDDIDRYTIIYKREFMPSEDEISARRNGEEWNEKTAKHYAQQRDLEKQKIIAKNVPVQEVIPNSNYKQKYAHLIGEDAALEAAKKTQSNKTYGFVPSENKRDIRSIEQTMADIQARKRVKTTTTIPSQPE